MLFAIVEFPCVRIGVRNDTKETFSFDALMKEYSGALILCTQENTSACERTRR